MQRWIVAALGLLVVVVAVFLLTQQTGDRADTREDAPAVAESQETSTTAGEGGGDTSETLPEGTQAESSQSADDQTDTDGTGATGSAETAGTDQAEPESEDSAEAAADVPAAGPDAQSEVGEGGTEADLEAAGEAQGAEVETEQSAAVSVPIEDQMSEAASAAESEDKDSQIAALPDSREVPESIRPSFDIVRIEGNGEAVLAGRAEPGSDVTLYAGDASLASVVADSNGNWVLLPDRPLPAGSHKLTLRSRSPEGVETESADAVIVVVPDAPRAVAQATPEQAGSEAGDAETGEPATEGSLTFGQPDGEQDGAEAAPKDALAVLVPRDGAGASQVLQQPDSAGIQDDQLVLLAVDYDASGRIVVSGRAAPGARVVAYLDDAAVGQGTANDSGRWVVSPNDTVSPGLHRLRIDQVDEAGSVIARVETPFSRAEMLTALPNERFVIVQPGNSLWRIAHRTYGSGFRYSVIYQSNADQIRDPDLIYPGQVFMLPQETEESN